ncbi:MAG TPA: transcription antitermination factor NusB [Methylomirabilota bacterium]|jgi:N utilization substance protein B|nr:transcription antitermination factor NusB [Methylomirabilota bacterium]
MGRRRKARELALQLLYELELRGDSDLDATADEFWRRQAVPDAIRSFADTIVRGTRANQPKIDELIGRFAEHWDLDRMAVVDRNILRAGIFELLWGGEVPPKVAINEALDIARKFSTEESTRFINGVLDRVRRELSP